MEHLTGIKPDGCPWIAFENPIVLEVAGLYRSCINQAGATPSLLIPLDPPNAVYEGVLQYAEAIDRIRWADSQAKDG